MNLRLPHIDGADQATQLKQIRSYLYQLSGELNWALGAMEKGAGSISLPTAPPTAAQKAQNAQASFAELKSLIIKSADIVEAYYEQISKRLEGQYVAVSQFGTYKQDTALQLSANSQSLQLMFDNQQALTTDVTALNGDLQDLQNHVDGMLRTDETGTTILGSQAWCKIGVLDEESSGFPIYGMEIGQINEENGVTVYKKFAQYRSDGVHLFDQNGTEVATISDQQLRVTNAKISSATITHQMKLGGYSIGTDNGLVVKWAE